MRRFDFPRKLGVLEFLFGKLFSAKGVGWVECSNALNWKLDLDDTSHRWIVYGKYEGGLGIDLARKVLENGGLR